MKLPTTLPSAGAAALLLLSAPCAHASIVAYDFSATVSELTYYAHTSPAPRAPEADGPPIPSHQQPFR
jgi:hypothetical protein